MHVAMPATDLRYMDCLPSDCYRGSMDPHRPLRVRDILGWVAEEDRDAFGIADIVEQFGVRAQVARDAVARMAAANQIRPIRRGRYLPLPPNHWYRPDTPLVADWRIVGKELVAPDPYFLAYYTAMEVHRMVQHPLTTLFVATTAQRRPIVVGPVNYRFVTLTEAKFAFGHEPVQVQRGKAVEIADLERTFLDAVDRPRLCGGIEEVARGIARRHEDLERERLLRYVVELDVTVVTKRLGFLLEIVGHSDTRLMRELEKRAARLAGYKPLVPGLDHRVFERNKRWELDINVDPDRLIRAVET